MLVTLIVSMYTSRVILNVLGIEDFGIYNIVAGFVTMLGFLNNAMSTATQRFLAFEIGQNNNIKLRFIFSMSLNIHFIIALVIVILAETVGLWFLNTQLNIAPARIASANFVYQFSILTLVVNVISVPFNAMIIVFERMKIFAWVSIVDVGLKLLIIYFLVGFGVDKLKLYSVLVFFVAFIVNLIYFLYCKKKYQESKYIFHWDKKTFFELINFSGWSIFGSISWVAMGQGLNVLLNIFFGPIVNAARGIAFQVNGIVTLFVNNFRTAVNPQIIKSFSNGDIGNMNKLAIESAKISFFLLLLITLPIFLEIKTFLELWLDIVPEYTVIFCRLMLIITLIHTLDISIVFSARGRIKENQFYGGLVYLLIVPTSYIFLSNGFSPEIVFYIQIVATLIVDFWVNLYLAKKIADISPDIYFRQLLLPILKVLLLAFPIPILLRFTLQEGFFRLILCTGISILSLLTAVYFVGIDKRIKEMIKSRMNIQKN